jgi:hypothetical protein
MTRILLAVLCFFAMPIITNAQCHCDFIIPTDTLVWQFDGIEHHVQPGDTICFASGVRRGIGFQNLHGTKEHPIVITNMCDGSIVLEGRNWGNAVAIDNSSYVHMTGAANPAIPYGIEITGGIFGINFKLLTTNVEADHLKIGNTASVGFVAKTDPTCDPATWRGNFTMKNLKFHHNYLHHTGHEGFYIGNSHYDTGVIDTCNNSPLLVWEHDLDSVEVYQNELLHIGNDGIQVGGATHARIHDNVVHYFAEANNDQHMNGIQVGSGTTQALVYNNTIDFGGYAFADFGGGGTWYNNTARNCRSGGFILQDDAPNFAPTGYRIYNNTLVNYGGYGVDFYSLNPDTTKFVNNILLGSSYYMFYNGSRNTFKAYNNLTTTNAAAINFVDTASGNFHLQDPSTAINTGLNTGILSDKDGVTRPKGSAYDIGAYESLSTTNPPVVNTARFNFTNAEQGIPGWTDMAGSPHLGVITGYDMGLHVFASSISTAQWPPVSYAGSSYPGGVYNGTVQPAAVVLTNWFNYSAPYNSVVNNVLQGDNVEVTGLIPNHSYELHIGASRRTEGLAEQYGTMEYRFNGTIVRTLLITDNATNEVVVNVNSDANGRIGISARKISGTAMNFGYIGWLVINNLTTTAAKTASTEILAYPNPTTSSATLNLQSFKGQAVEMKLVTTGGQVLQTRVLTGSSCTINTAGLQSGVYMITLRSKDKVITTRLLVEK